MNQYLLFDLDGTLTDPKLGITTCVQYALNSFGIIEEDLDKLEPFIGPPLKDSFMNFYGMNEEQAEAAIAKYRERFSTVGMYENEVYPGVARMLRRCKNRGAKLAVASSKPEVFVKKILEHFHLAKYFDVIVGSELDGRRTDKQEVVQEALFRLFGDNDIDYDNVVMIGDRKFDIEGANENKVTGVAVSYGYGSIEELKEAKAEYIARSVDELEEFLLRGRRRECENTDISWHKPGIITKLCIIFVPILVYVLVSDMLRMLASIFVAKYRLTGDMVAVINGVVFIITCVTIWLVFGRTDLAQERFAFKVRNANEYNGAGFTAEAYEWTLPGQRKSYMKKLYVRKLLGKLLIVLLGAGASVGFNFLFSLTDFTRISADFQAVSERQMGVSLIMGLILYGIISPLAEEMIFRGVVFNRMKRYMPVILSAIISSALFGIYHGNVVQAVYAFMAGCLFAWIYHKRGRFGEAVMLHGIMNIAGFLLAHYNLFDTAFYGWLGCVLSFGVALIAAFGLLLCREY